MLSACYRWTTANKMFQDQIDDLQIELSKHNEAKRTLRKLNLFVLDNSLRETGFGHLRGHTLENKWKIYKEVSLCVFCRRKFFSRNKKIFKK